MSIYWCCVFCFTRARSGLWTANPATATALAVNISPSPGNAILCTCLESLIYDIWLLIAHEFVSYFLKSPSTLLHAGFRTYLRIRLHPGHVSPYWLQRRNALSCNRLFDNRAASTRRRRAPHRTVPRRRRCRRAGCATERISKVDRRHTLELARHGASRLFAEAPRVSSLELSSSWAGSRDSAASCPASARELAFAQSLRDAGEVEPDFSSVPSSLASYP